VSTQHAKNQYEKDLMLAHCGSLLQFGRRAVALGSANARWGKGCWLPICKTGEGHFITATGIREYGNEADSSILGVHHTWNGSDRSPCSKHVLHW